MFMHIDMRDWKREDKTLHFRGGASFRNKFEKPSDDRYCY